MAKKRVLCSIYFQEFRFECIHPSTRDYGTIKISHLVILALAKSPTSRNYAYI